VTPEQLDDLMAQALQVAQDVRDDVAAAHRTRIGDVVAGAFKGVVDSIDAGIEQPVLYGTPA
jgi:hypothetical protein